DEKASSQYEPNISEPHDRNIEINNEEMDETCQNSVADICFKTGVSDKTAKNQVYAIIRASLSN
ncbi:6661_t:CDS:2, partial [Cetraspora pellucida]